jgi:hypothetical protein
LGSTPTTLTLPPYHCSNTADKPAAAGSDEKRVDIGSLLLRLQPDGSLAQKCFALVEGVDRERS